MNLKYATASVVALAMLAGSAASADAGITLVGSGNGGWVSFPEALNDYGNVNRPFWDQRSMDTGNRNIGNYLAGSYTLPLPAGASPTPNITPDWWSIVGPAPLVGGAPMNADPNLRFVSGANEPVNSTMMLEVAGNRNFNEIGWYDTSDAAGMEVLNPIYSGADSPLAAAMFTPSASWGLYIRSHNGYAGAGQGLLFFMDSSRNRANGPAALAANDLLVQHFALFAESLTPGAERYIVGVEDLPLRSTNIENFGDYNDVVLTVQAVPAPGALALLGLTGLVVARRRR